MRTSLFLFDFHNGDYHQNLTEFGRFFAYASSLPLDSVSVFASALPLLLLLPRLVSSRPRRFSAAARRLLASCLVSASLAHRLGPQHTHKKLYVEKLNIYFKIDNH